MSDPLRVLVEYLYENGFSVLYASYIGSYQTEDWIENVSDIDIMVVIDGKKPRKLPRLDDVDVIVLTSKDLENIDTVLAVDIIFSKPIIDTINLREIVGKKLNEDELVLLNDVMRELDELSKNSPALELGCGILLYPIIRKICAILSYLHNEKWGLRKLGKEILQTVGADIIEGLLKIKTAYNKVLKVGEKHFDDYVTREECLNTLETLRKFVRILRQNF